MSPAGKKKAGTKKSFWRRMLFNWPVAIVLLIIAGLWLAMFAVFYVDFMRVDEIQMVSLDGEVRSLKIPVRYLGPGRKLEHTEAVSFTGANNWRYSIRQNRGSDEIWIQISRLGFGGLAAYAARYEVTDPAVETRLRAMLAAGSEAKPVEP